MNWTEIKPHNMEPTHLVKILQSDYNNNPANITINIIGSKKPAFKDDLGYNVLCEDGVYRYMSIFLKQIEVVGTIENYNPCKKKYN